MLLDDNTAGEKHCPAQFDVATGNKKCKGSACAAWNWFDNDTGQGTARKGWCGLSLSPIIPHAESQG